MLIALFTVIIAFATVWNIIVLEASDRPWLGVTGGSVDTPIGAGGALHVQLFLENSGKRPALNFTEYSYSWIGPSPITSTGYPDWSNIRLPQNPKCHASPKTVKSNPAVFPATKAISDISPESPITDANAQELQRGSRTLYVVDCLDYDDDWLSWWPFTGPHRTSVCMFYNPLSKTMDFCKQMNAAS